MEMDNRGKTDLDYTWHGVLVTDCDALLLLEKCLRGELEPINRRPHDSERARLIKSGSVFVYESGTSGIKRWTDGINWSPSRILTNFLVYHELDKPPPPGEKKRAIKRKRSDSEVGQVTPTLHVGSLDGDWTDDDRRLMGSPQDNYGWKIGGLVKKTYSFDFRGQAQHIISYFDPKDVRSGKLQRPIHCEEFSKLYIRPELVEQGTRSRNPITETQLEQQRWERPLYQNDTTPFFTRTIPNQMEIPYMVPSRPLSTFAPQNHMIVTQSSHPPPRLPDHFQHVESLHLPGDSTGYLGSVTQPLHQPRHSFDHMLEQQACSSYLGDSATKSVGSSTLTTPSYSHSSSLEHLSQVSNHLSGGVIYPKKEDYANEDERATIFSGIPTPSSASVISPSRRGPSVQVGYTRNLSESVHTHNVIAPALAHDASGSYVASANHCVATTKKVKTETLSDVAPSPWPVPGSAHTSPAVRHPTTGHGDSLAHAHTHRAIAFSHGATLPLGGSYAYHHAGSTPNLYDGLGHDFGVSQGQGIFMQGYSSQLTAPS